MAGTVFLGHVFPFDDRGDGRGVGGRPADAQFLQFLDQAGFRIAGAVLAEHFSGSHAMQFQALPLLQGGQAAFVFLVLFVVLAFGIDFEETVEEHHFAFGDEIFLMAADADVHLGLFYFGFAHLGGDGAFPDQVVEPCRRGVSVDGRAAHLGGTYGFVGFLRSFGLGAEVARMAVAFSVYLGNLFLGHLQRESGEVHRVGTHISDVPFFIKLLGQGHGPGDREPKLARSFLLQGGGGERRCRVAFGRLHFQGRYRERGRSAGFQKGLGFLFGLETGVEFGSEIPERGGHFVDGSLFEILDFLFAFHDQADGYRLHASRREVGPHLAPQQRRDFVPDQAV